jgi:HNH endonuclease
MPRQCSVAGCDRRVNMVCSVADCNRPATKKQLCQTHADRKRKFGDVQADKSIRATAGTGYLNHGYLVVPVPVELRYLADGETATAEHRFVMARHLGRALSADESVHHKNGDRPDNRIEKPRAVVTLATAWSAGGRQGLTTRSRSCGATPRTGSRRLVDRAGSLTSVRTPNGI